VYRPKSLRRHQFFTMTGWPGGNYASPGMGGSRSGGIIAATWAAMLSLGRHGYRTIAHDIFHTAAALKAAIRAWPELQLIGDSLRQRQKGR
jgi:sphinganine-1-phosphate aldolase